MKGGDKMYVRKVLFISKLALSLVLGFMVVRTVLLPEYIEKNLAPSSAAGWDRMRTDEAASSPKLSSEDYAEIVEMNLFGTSDGLANSNQWALTAGSFGLEHSISEELGLALFGTISGSSAVARAIIKDLKTGVLDLYEVGQTVGDAYIKSIEEGAVILLCNGQRRILRFNPAKSGSNNNDNTQSSPSPTINEMNGAVKTDLPVEQASTAVRTKIGRVETILKKAVIEPYVIDGQIEGLRITSLKNIPEAKDLGLKDGDVIRVVNGHRLTSKQKAYQIFKKARSRATVNFELLRDGKIKKLSFTLR